MEYNSYAYLLVLLGTTFIIYYIVPKKARGLVLLLSSYIFYYISSGKHVVFPIFTTISVYLCGIIIDKIDNKLEKERKNVDKQVSKTLKKKANFKKKILIAIVAVCNLSVLFILKYLNFFSLKFFALIGKQSPFTLKLTAAMGMSFYTLQAVSYLVDIYRGTIKPDKNFLRFALYISFFPTVVEGPISRYKQLAYQSYEGHNFDVQKFVHGCEMIMWGMFKKVVIADRLNMFVGAVFDNYANYSGIIIAVATLFYTIQIYCEFSGCMDIVTGSARLFGITLEKNFNHPFISHDVNEFWRRWHITLGTWLRDYVFYSISLSKPFQRFSKKVSNRLKGYYGNILPTVIALFAVWFCNGLWHGASTKYILYGLYYYVIMTSGMLLKPLFTSIQNKLKINTKSKPYKAFQIIRTFILVNIGMLMFRAQNVPVAFKIFASSFKNIKFSVLWDGTLLNLKLDKYDFILLAFCMVILITVSILQEKGKSIYEMISKQKLPVRWIVYFAAIFIVILFGAYGNGYDAAAFIYAQF